MASLVSRREELSFGPLEGWLTNALGRRFPCFWLKWGFSKVLRMGSLKEKFIAAGFQEGPGIVLW